MSITKKFKRRPKDDASHVSLKIQSNNDNYEASGTGTGDQSVAMFRLIFACMKKVSLFRSDFKLASRSHNVTNELIVNKPDISDKLLISEGSRF